MPAPRKPQRHGFPLLSLTHTRYDVLALTREAVCLADASDGACRTLTNEAAAVAREVQSLAPGRRIYYRDSSGEWAELCHRWGEFRGFAPLDAAALSLLEQLLGREWL